MASGGEGFIKGASKFGVLGFGMIDGMIYRMKEYEGRIVVKGVGKIGNEQVGSSLKS